MASLHIDNVSKTFGGTSVLRGVSLDIPDGEFVTLVGPSGCGKSTLLRIIAGLEGMSGGAIRIGDRLVNGVSAKDRDISMVFQNYALYPHMNVRDNMSFAMRLKKAPMEKITAQVERAASILGLSGLLDRLPRQLSGGQRQRVAMGRAIVRDPKVFLFDEPLSNLDAKLRVSMRAEIKTLHQRLRTTTVYVTHDQIEAMTMADRIVVMRDGVVEQVGEPLALYDRPQTIFVAGFIGSPAMNFLDGTMVPVEPPMFHSDSGIALPLQEAPAVSLGTPLVLGFRPEHVILGQGGFSAEVRGVEPTGSETLVSLTSNGADILALLRDRTPLRPGSMVEFRPNPENLHLFDKASGRRVN